MNLLEEKDGFYRIHPDYEKNLQIVLDTPYSEERVKIRRHRDGKRKVAVPAVTTKLDLSENERKDLQRSQHISEREKYYSPAMREERKVLHESYEKMKRELFPHDHHNDFKQFVREWEICENPKELTRLYREKMEVQEGSG